MPDRVHTSADVQAWLSAIGYARYGPTFAANEISGDVLRTLTSDELRDDLGVIGMIERSGAKTPAYDPDRFGVLGMLFSVLTAAVFVLAIILVDGF
eukprot:contig_39270_g9116